MAVEAELAVKGLEVAVAEEVAPGLAVVESTDIVVPGLAGELEAAVAGAAGEAGPLVELLVALLSDG